MSCNQNCQTGDGLRQLELSIATLPNNAASYPALVHNATKLRDNNVSTDPDVEVEHLVTCFLDVLRIAHCRGLDPHTLITLARLKLQPVTV